MTKLAIKNLILGVVGGVGGGVIGFLICKWLSSQGFYAVVIPGSLVGMGFGYCARKRHVVFGCVSGILGLFAGLITQWKVYSNEPSFWKLVGELKDYSAVTWIMLGLGTVFAVSFGTGRNSGSPPRQTESMDSSR